MAIGGGIGSLMRFAIAQWVFSMSKWAPLSILIINVSGCFAISFLNFVSDPSGDIYLGPRSRLFLLVGVCGGYTTFSSFSLISFVAARHGALADLWLNIGLVAHPLPDQRLGRSHRRRALPSRLPRPVTRSAQINPPTIMLLAIVLVFFGGAVGSMWRYWWSGLIAQRFGETFPFGTLAVNIVGSILIGIFAGLVTPYFERHNRGCTSAITGGRSLRRVDHFFVI